MSSDPVAQPTVPPSSLVTMAGEAPLLPPLVSKTDPALLDSLPTEILISFLQLLHPVDVMAFGQTSTRHYYIVIDNDDYWLEVCFQILRMNTPQPITKDLLRGAGAQLLRAVAAGVTGAIANPFFHIYKNNLAHVGWQMGSWVATNQRGVSELWDTQFRLRLEQDGTCNIVTLSGPDLLVNPPPSFGSQPLFSVIANRLAVATSSGTLNIGGHNFGAAPNSYYMIGVSGTHGFVLPTVEGQEFSRRDPRAGDGNAISAFRSKTTNSNFNDAPYPSPTLAPAFLDTRLNPSPYLPSSLGDCLKVTITGREWSLLRLRRPEDFPSASTDLIQPGIYTAPYPGCGPEYVYVNIRKLTEADFDASSWPWDGSLASAASPPPPQRGRADPVDWSNPNIHLGPFSNIFRGSWASPIRVSQAHVRPGVRVVEVIKIVGDEFVPQGARSIVAFLEDPLVSSENLHEAEQNLPEKIQYDEEECPWPIIPDVVSRGLTLSPGTILQKQYAPSRGIDLPACARVASHGFELPQWRNCTVHVESRTQFSAWWHDLRSVSVFTKIGRASFDWTWELS